ncbi:protein kinase C delta type-like isoform X2 [Xenopus laevis]|uniref:Protein kinase C delta type isoform X2 n=1 Tax=Xenopus laevis TaxID=8355 RepID=A0A8J1M7V8_XENLA|nr:protein kinase C delta type isoform X2 [Xenopus laevis]XP_041437789.1 protein kinase C delta type-like isoform X2 [Xenopus laevis]
MAKSCPFLCHLHAAFQSEVQVFFVLEYACGGTLNNIISKNGRLPTETIHDLKPDNILVDRGGHIKICDFGISAEGLFDKKLICGLGGTPGYRAPEVLLLEWYNAGADWWSLGVTIYEMATAKQPFSPSISVVKEFISIKTPEYPSHMSQELQDLLSKLLEKDKKQRLGVNGNIREHPFFASINWENLEKKKVKTPFQPKMPFASEFSVISPGLSADAFKRERVEELSYVDPTWHWQE